MISKKGAEKEEAEVDKGAELQDQWSMFPSDCSVTNLRHLLSLITPATAAS